MQIRLTVLGPRSGHTTRACDVLVTAPAGTALASVAGSLAASVAGPGADIGSRSSGPGGGGSSPVALYAGTERLDPQRAVIGEPPLIDGAVLSLHGPGPSPAHGLPHGPARLRVVSGPDAGGVHLLHGGQIRIGRSADADVPLDDPDVSRLHCAVTVEPDGSVLVADLRSTNGTSVDGTDLGERPTPLRPGALLRVGESALRLQASPGSPDPALQATPDGEGHLRIAPGTTGGTGVGAVRGSGAGGPGAGTTRGRGAGGFGAGAADGAAAGGFRGGSDAAAAARIAAGRTDGPDGHGAAGRQQASRGSLSSQDSPSSYGPEALWSYGPEGGHASHVPQGAQPTYLSDGSESKQPPHVPEGSLSSHSPRRTQASYAPRGAQPSYGSEEADAGMSSPAGPQFSVPSGGGESSGAVVQWPAPEGHEPGAYGSGHPESGARHSRTGEADGASPAGHPAAPDSWDGPYDPYGAEVRGAGNGRSAGTPPTPACAPGSGPARRDTPLRGTAPGDAPTGPPQHTELPDHDQSHGHDRNYGHDHGTPYGTPQHEASTDGFGPGVQDFGSGVRERTQDRSPKLSAAPPSSRLRSNRGDPHEQEGPPSGAQDLTHGGQQALAPADAVSRKGARRGGIGAWARRLTGGRSAAEPAAAPAPVPAPVAGPASEPPPSPAAEAVPSPGSAAPERWPDAASILLTALGPGPRLWERGQDHPDALTVRLGTAAKSGGRDAVPVTVELRRAGSLGLAGPRARLTGLARSAVAQLAALHSPGTLEIVLISTDRARSTEERIADWSWLGWLPHVRPAHGQDCRLLLAYDKEQATARTAELVRRLDDGPLGPGWPSADRAGIASAAARHQGPYTLVIVDGDLGSSALRETAARLASGGAAAGIHLICLAETPAASPSSPLSATYEAARKASPAFGECGAVAVLSGDVATALRVVQPGSGPNGTVATLDAVSDAWAERFARALAPLREADTTTMVGGRTVHRAAVPLPESTRLLDELGLARATPASLMARWAAALDSDRPSVAAVLGAGPHGPLAADLAADGSHLLVEGAAATGKTELLRSLAASLAAADRPDLLSMVLVDGGGSDRGEGLRVCTDLPHVTTYLAASDPVRMREFAQALTSELKRRAEILAGTPFAEWRTKHLPAPRIIAPRRSSESSNHDGGSEEQELITLRNRCRNKEKGGGGGTSADTATTPPLSPGPTPSSTPPPSPSAGPSASTASDRSPGPPGTASSGSPASASTTGTLRLRARSGAPAYGAPSGGAVSATAAPAPSADDAEAAAPMPRLFVLVDDFDALVSPALGSTGRPAAGSVVRALEAVARDGATLGVHLIAATGHPERTADTATSERAGLRVQLGPATDLSEPVPPGRGRLHRAEDGSSTPFQVGRVTGRIPRTSTLRPTVVPLEWQRMGDPPARRPLRELGNGPTDLALLASALQRAAESSGAPSAPPLV
ncbi:FtsK/SpoIIIE domain-containing protein [Streptomyces halobius]|uniref:FHA domain-containing protein n=2 Tax=Streptomyces halobius TaxID=2879846 RepID=A0ABY4MK55_9ACTN|nr:FtsK/SpoIIIE domain-containing protein [Streptomyces halobius]UQA97968.1 FHA domain-containing protein [Streptomyces halobius]